MIEFRGVRYAYRQDAAPALDGVDLAVERGAFVVLIGANGSGKSTLLRLLDGLLVPQSGSVRVGDLDSRSPSARWEMRRRVGLVFQNPDSQLVAATVADEVAFGPENLGLPPPEIRRRVRDALSAVGLAAAVGREPHSLSGGERQRLAVAGVLAMEPDVLAVDEPTALLDAGSRRRVFALLRRLRRERQATVVCTTHRTDEALGADRVVVLDRGRIAIDGAPRTVFAEPDRLAALGIEPPAVVRLASLLRQAGLALPPVLTADELAAALLP